MRITKFAGLEFCAMGK